MMTPDSTNPPAKCTMHEQRIQGLETGQNALREAIHSTKDAILDELHAFRTQLFGNGQLTRDGLQAGIFPLIDRRISAVERRTEFEERVADEVVRREEVGRQHPTNTSGDPLTYGSGLLGHQVKKEISATPLWGWTLLVIVLGPKGVELLLSLISGIHALMAGVGP